MNGGPEGPKKNIDRVPEPKFPKKAEEIERMFVVDQDMREKSFDDDSVWNEEVDNKNTEAMKQVVAEIGWPTVSKVGKEASHDAWLLVQHADHDPKFQQECLALMKQESESEVSPVDIAYLEDRIRVNTGQGQVYGTQFHETRNDAGNVVRYEPRPIEDPDHLDERRVKVGLEPHAEYSESLTKKYYPHLLEKE